MIIISLHWMANILIGQRKDRGCMYQAVLVFLPSGLLQEVHELENLDKV